MSITFSVEGIEEEHGYDLPCPDCGLSMDDVVAIPGGSYVNAKCSCLGYGGPDKMPVVRYELNVSNVNAAALLDHLGIELDHCGAVEPLDVLAALAVRDPAELLRTVTHRDGGWIGNPRSVMTVAHYYERLTRIAKMALEYRRRVVWG